MPTSTYQSGDCMVLTYTPQRHELWHRGVLVACFKAFRDAVRYQLQEFP